MAKLKAVYISREIPITKIKGLLPFKQVQTTRETATYQLDGSTVFVYSFGSIVFSNTNASEEEQFIGELQKRINLKQKRITEEYEITKDIKTKRFIVKSSCVIVKRYDLKLLSVVARVLAQSVALESYEEGFDKMEEEFTELNERLSEKGKLAQSSKEVMKMMARNNIVMEEIVSGIGVLDKPDAAWDSGLLDALHTRLSDEFELNERFQNLNSKMDFVQDNYKVFLESLRSRTDARLEWIIIILIAIEIILFIYELFW